MFYCFTKVNHNQTTIPTGSMYGIFAYMLLIAIVNVGTVNIPYMDLMGLGTYYWNFFQASNMQIQAIGPFDHGTFLFMLFPREGDHDTNNGMVIMAMNVQQIPKKNASQPEEKIYENMKPPIFVGFAVNQS